MPPELLLAEEVKEETVVDERILEYRITDALREGTKTSRQAFGAWSTEDGAMCALSTMAHVLHERGYV